MMITSKKELAKCLETERKIYIPDGTFAEKFITSDISLYIYRFVKLLRKTEYYHNSGGSINKFLYAFYRRRKNRLGVKLGIEIWDNTFDTGLTIDHAGYIVINGMSRIGKNCRLHGDNCIGNDGKTLDSPVIGDNVQIGVGAKIIGNIRIADNCRIAAGAVVISSFDEEGITIAGVPARKVK